MSVDMPLSIAVTCLFVVILVTADAVVLAAC